MTKFQNKVLEWYWRAGPTPTPTSKFWNPRDAPVLRALLSSFLWRRESFLTILWSVKRQTVSRRSFLVLCNYFHNPFFLFLQTTRFPSLPWRKTRNFQLAWPAMDSRQFRLGAMNKRVQPETDFGKRGTVQIDISPTEQNEEVKPEVKLLFLDLSPYQPSVQFLMCCSGVFCFYLIYGYCQVCVCLSLTVLLLLLLLPSCDGMLLECRQCFRNCLLHTGAYISTARVQAIWMVPHTGSVCILHLLRCRRVAVQRRKNKKVTFSKSRTVQNSVLWSWFFQLYSPLQDPIEDLRFSGLPYSGDYGIFQLVPGVPKLSNSSHFQVLQTNTCAHWRYHHSRWVRLKERWQVWTSKRIVSVHFMIWQSVSTWQIAYRCVSQGEWINVCSCRKGFQVLGFLCLFVHEYRSHIFHVGRQHSAAKF